MPGNTRDNRLLIVRKTAEYQFGRGVGVKLFPRDVEIKVSRRTGKVRYVYLGQRLLATMNPGDGRLLLSYEGAVRLSRVVRGHRFRVVVNEEAGPFVEKGRDVFSRHIVSADGRIRPGEEVIVEGTGGEILAVGKAVLSGEEIGKYSRGVAVKVREGRK